MRIVLDLDCEEPENFKAALVLFKALKYTTTYAKKTIEELTEEVFFSVDLEATLDELGKFMKMDVFSEKAE